ncbi:hypothetical protein, partial [Aeromonas caviae]|uniref:hypothetical protein n=1 Tax=Aeromonas caviae TaxID=648 RepID=UPI0035A21F3B
HDVEVYPAILFFMLDGGQVDVLPIQSGKGQRFEVVQHRYSSAAISWAVEEAPRPEEISAVLDDFEALAFAG